MDDSCSRNSGSLESAASLSSRHCLSYFTASHHDIRYTLETTVQCHRFLADRTNGGTYACCFRLSSVTYVLWLNGASYQKNCLKKQIGNGLSGIEWSRDR